MASIDMNKVKRVLDKLLNSNEDIVGAAIISNVGLMLTGNLPENFDEDKVSAVFTALESIAQRASQQMAFGDLIQLVVFAKNGGALLYSGKKSSLIVLMKPDAKLGLILIDVMDAVEELKEVLGFSSPGSE